MADEFVNVLTTWREAGMSDLIGAADASDCAHL
jgi:hypothetical protein